jgi:hypothetical protein
LFELGDVLALGIGVAFVLLELCFELKILENLESERISWDLFEREWKGRGAPYHHVSAVEDQR